MKAPPLVYIIQDHCGTCNMNAQTVLTFTHGVVTFSPTSGCSQLSNGTIIQKGGEPSTHRFHDKTTPIGRDARPNHYTQLAKYLVMIIFLNWISKAAVFVFH